MPYTMMQFKPENTLGGKAKAAIGGAPIRVASGIAGIPKSMGETFNYLAKVLEPPESALNIPGPTPQIPQGLLDLLPSKTSLTNKLKGTLIEDLLPKGALEPHPMIDNPLEFAATAPLFGAAKGVGYLGSALRALPAGIGGETLRQGAEALHFGPGGQLVADVAGTLLGGYGASKVGDVASKFKGAVGRKVEQKLPLGKEIGSAARREELKAKQLAREEAKSKAIEERFLNKQKEQLKKDLERYNTEQIKDKTRSDVAAQKVREHYKKQIDKFQADTDKLLSQKDALALKEKIDKGQKINLNNIKELSPATATEAELGNIRLTEESIIDTMGAHKSELRSHAADLYDQWRESTPKDYTVSSRYIEPMIDYLDELIGEGFGKEATSSKREIEKLIQGFRQKAKGGEVGVRDLSVMRQDIRENIRDLIKSKGDLSRFEQKMPKIDKLLDKSLDLAKEKYPEIKLEKLRKADRIYSEVKSAEMLNKELKSLIESSLPLKRTRYVLKWLGDKTNSKYLWSNPEVKKYYKAALSAWGKKNSSDALRNILALDNILKKEYEALPMEAATKGAKGTYTMMQFKGNI